MLKADLLSLEVQLAQTQENLAAARHGAALAERAFLFALGLDAAGRGVELPADDPALARLAVPDSGDFSQRPELLGLQERVRAAEAMVRAARGGRLPTVNAFASYQYDRGWQLRRDADSWMAGVSVDLNVFDGGQTSGKIRQATDVALPEPQVIGARWRIRDHERERGARDQQDSARFLRVEKLVERA